jgi:hypothetical protein
MDDFDAAIMRVLDKVESTPAGCSISRETVKTARRGGDESTSFVSDERNRYVVTFWSGDTVPCGETVINDTLEGAVTATLDRIASVQGWAKSRREQNAALGVGG